MPLSDLILTKLASPDFSMDKVRKRIVAGRPKMSDAERATHVRRHLDVVKAHFDYWTDPKWLAEMGMDADNQSNIRAACLFCNRTRHRMKQVLDPDVYRAYVRRRMAKGKWHPH